MKKSQIKFATITFMAGGIRKTSGPIGFVCSSRRGGGCGRVMVIWTAQMTERVNGRRVNAITEKENSGIRCRLFRLQPLVSECKEEFWQLWSSPRVPLMLSRDVGRSTASGKISAWSRREYDKVEFCRIQGEITFRRKTNSPKIGDRVLNRWEDRNTRSWTYFSSNFRVLGRFYRCWFISWG